MRKNIITEEEFKRLVKKLGYVFVYDEKDSSIRGRVFLNKKGELQIKVESNKIKEVEIDE